MVAIEKSRHTTLERVLTAIGIPNVGKKTAKQLAGISYQVSANNELSIVHILFVLTEEELLAVKDI